MDQQRPNTHHGGSTDNSPNGIDDDPGEMGKRSKGNDLVSNAAALHNVVDITHVLRELTEESYLVNADVVARLSPCGTRTIHRFEYCLMPAGEPP
jgi:hypothetical protein